MHLTFALDKTQNFANSSSMYTRIAFVGSHRFSARESSRLAKSTYITRKVHAALGKPTPLRHKSRINQRMAHNFNISAHPRVMQHSLVSKIITPQVIVCRKLAAANVEKGHSGMSVRTEQVTFVFYTSTLLGETCSTHTITLLSISAVLNAVSVFVPQLRMRFLKC